MSTKYRDQADYLKDNAELTAEIASLENRIRATGREVPARPVVSNADVIGDNDALTLHRAKLMGMLSGAAPAVKAAAAKAGKMNWTEKILAAQGCKTLEEVARKRANAAGERD